LKENLFENENIGDKKLISIISYFDEIIQFNSILKFFINFPFDKSPSFFTDFGIYFLIFI
jgi:hypothetical protein